MLHSCQIIVCKRKQTSPKTFRVSKKCSTHSNEKYVIKDRYCQRFNKRNQKQSLNQNILRYVSDIIYSYGKYFVKELMKPFL